MTTLIARNLKTLNNILTDYKFREKNIGLVPTMGAIHRGHLALVNKSLKSTEKTIVTIFVNPMQFNNKEDFNNYPDSIKEDIAILTKKKVDLIFIPKKEEIYPSDFSTFVHLKKFDDILCGKNRKNHFAGVATVVLKLFSLIKPQHAFFGEKDYQQLIIIKKLVSDFNLGMKIHSVKTVRDSKGLALSSRNNLLSESQKEKASKINNILKNLSVKNIIGKKKFLGKLEKKLSINGVKNIEYLEVRDDKSLELYDEKKSLGKSYRIFIAVKFGKIRLIDNLRISK